MKIIKRKVSLFSVFVAGIVVFTLAFIMLNSNKPLTPYTEPTVPSESSAESNKKQYTTYLDEELLFSISVPSDWVKVTQNGYPTWICREYNSSFQIQKFSSSESLLDITSETIRQEIENLGGELVEFFWIDEWNYTVSYRMFQESVTTAHIELTAFNTKDAVRFAFIITETNYSELSETVSEMIDSFAWDRFNDKVRGD